MASEILMASPISRNPMTRLWQWQTQDGRPYLTCDLLSPWPHGFFTQQWWPQPPGQLTQVLNPESSSTFYRVKQVHGNVVLNAGDLSAVDLSQEKDTAFEQADGLISAEPGQTLWVCSADCTPALIGDIRTGQVSAVHAGWRGTAARILPVAIAKFQEQGSHLSDLRVALGPAIAGEVYQVDRTVAAQTGRSLRAYSEMDDDALLNQLSAMPGSPLFTDPEPDKVRLHVRQVSVLQLLELGFAAEQISVAPHCTYQDPENFFSYRRTGEKKVQWSGIVSQSTL